MNETIDLLDKFAQSYGLGFVVTAVIAIVVWRAWRKDTACQWAVLRDLTDVIKDSMR